MTPSIFDVMPIKVLEQLERIESAIPDLERRAFMLQADAQDLRLQREEIINFWRHQAEQEGFDKLVAEQNRVEMIAWHCDPLPCNTAGEAQGGFL